MEVDLSKVDKVISEVFYGEHHPKNISDNLSIDGDFRADSLEKAELILAIEDAFDIEIYDDKIEDVKTVGDVKKLVMEAFE